MRNGCPDTNAYFAHDALAIPYRSKAGYALVIEASCALAAGSTEFCAAGAASAPPPLSTGELSAGRSLPDGCPASQSPYLYSTGEASVSSACSDDTASASSTSAPPPPPPSSTPSPPPSPPPPPPPLPSAGWSCAEDGECSACSEDSSWVDVRPVRVYRRVHGHQHIACLHHGRPVMDVRWHARRSCQSLPHQPFLCPIRMKIAASLSPAEWGSSLWTTNLKYGAAGINIPV